MLYVSWSVQEVSEEENTSGMKSCSASASHGHMWTHKANVKQSKVCFQRGTYRRVVQSQSKFQEQDQGCQPVPGSKIRIHTLFPAKKNGYKASLYIYRLQPAVSYQNDYSLAWQVTQ